MDAKPELEEVACALCGGSRTGVRFSALEGWPPSRGDSYAATTDKFGAYGTIQQCLDCGLLFTSPRVRASSLLEEYQENKDEDFFLQSEARSMNAYLSLALIRRHAQAGRLLDVGCATGFFLNAARLSFEVEGVEPSKWARQYAKDRLKLEIGSSTIEGAHFPDARFDVVTLLDVIEHVPDPAGLMREVARVTKPQGLVYVVTPDCDSLSATLLGSRWWGLRPAHIYYFSRKTLTRLLEAAGYEVVEAKSFGRIFSWGYWLSRLTNYPRPVYRAVEALVDGLGIRDKFLYLDTRDSVELVARKKG
ncbi:MAG: class I SAM-dependent methyltransferase [Elusimicrobia bacterium]|nr:class I SAM-dependent methyltransferase [Elusimicrobiota bacterium]